MAEMIEPGSRIEAAVLAARQRLQQREFSRALAAAEALAEEVPENRDVLYLIAVSQRYLGRIQDALETLARLETLHPGYGRLFQERGHCYRAVGNASAAISAYRSAVALNASLPAGWQSLADLYRVTGSIDEAKNAAEMAAHLKALPVAVVTANSLFSEGETLAAEHMIRRFLLEQPDHVEGMRLLARIGMKLRVLDDAEFLLETVLDLAPDYRAARYEYAVVLADRQKHTRALEEIRGLLILEPRNPSYRAIEGNALVGLGLHEEALHLFHEILEETPANPTLHLAIGHAQKTVGSQADAIRSYRQAAQIRPSFGDAYWSLANLKTYRFTERELSQMRAEEAKIGIATEDRYHLCFALGKALEDLGSYEESFAYYERANALKRKEIRYHPGPLERTLQRQKEVCTSAFFAQRVGWGCHAADPIFIVGLPRAGSTLIEQVLASHSCVEGIKELPEIAQIVHRISGRELPDSTPNYPYALREIGAAQIKAIGEQFIADTRVYRQTGKPMFIDKMPNNFRHIGLIHLILPNAKIIDARRHPMACCFSNYKQCFAAGQEFTYGLEDIGRYYRAYADLMAHWDAVLPGKVFRVSHERLVDDLEHNVRSILNFLGLDFEPACLEYYRTARSVRTASSEQVRRPIYREGLDQWRHYESWLGPLRTALGPLALS